jgi:parvulin-like peptidyl-prolyl isomerase
LSATACSGSATSSVAARVGDTEITDAEVTDEFQQRAEAPQLASELAADEGDSLEESLRANVLTELIRSEIVQQAADERGIDISESEIAAQRASVVESVGGEESFQQILEESNVSDEQLQTTLRDQAIQTAIGEELADDVTDEQVRQAFEEDPQGQYGETVDVRHILTETRAQAQEAIDRIESGEDFAEVARDVSIDPGSAENGGDLGTVPRGATVPAFEEAAFDAEVGELVGPVETEFGFHVIEVTERNPAPSFDEVSDDVRQQLEAQAASQAFNEFIVDFVDGLDLDVDDQYGTWDATNLAVVPEQQTPPATELELPPPTEAPPAPSETPAG